MVSALVDMMQQLHRWRWSVGNGPEDVVFPQIDLIIPTVGPLIAL